MELPTPVASRIWRKPTGFRENAARAFAREPHSRDDRTKAGEFGWNPRCEIPRITIPSPRGCNRLLRKYPIRSRRRAIRHPASRQENASHQSSGWRASGRATARAATQYHSAFDSLLFLQAVHGIAVNGMRDLMAERTRQLFGVLHKIE